MSQRLAGGCCAFERGTAYTPGDFTYADLAADDLANLLAELGGGGGGR